MLFNHLLFMTGLLILSLLITTSHSAPNPKHPKYPLPYLPHNQQSPAYPFHASESRREAKPEELYLYPQKELIGLGKEVRRGLAWNKQIEYSGKTFFDGWDFFTDPDPSHGLVTYVDSSTAFKQGLAFWTGDGVPGIQVDHFTIHPPGIPRNSLRITSKALFAGGLFVFDLALMPWGCGVWPAIWMLGYDGEWPSTGEIDIVPDDYPYSPWVHYQPITRSLYWYSGGGSGCSIISPSPTSYGEGFNAAGGGVFACQWDGDGIRIWNWNRANIPPDITADAPTPSTWGTPAAAFDASTCDPGLFFQAQEMILNIDLCGDWAGDLYTSYPYCPGTCATYIANAKNLNNTVMLINSIKVYQQSGSSPLISQAEDSSNQTGAGGPIAPSHPPSGFALPSSGRKSVIYGLFVWICIVLGVGFPF